MISRIQSMPSALKSAICLTMIFDLPYLQGFKSFSKHFYTQPVAIPHHSSIQEIIASLAFSIIKKKLFLEFFIEKYLNNSLFYHSIQPFDKSLHSGILLKQIFQFLEHSDRVIYHAKRKKEKKKADFHALLWTQEKTYN